MTNARMLVIAGFPNSGTTVSAMILGQHPAAFATGELTAFPEKRQFADYNVCSCGAKVAACPFWCGVRDAYFGGPRDDARLVDIIAEQSGRPLVIDVAHRVDRVAELIANPALDLKVIHMVRQRVAVLNSRLRRLYGRGIVGAYRPSRLTKVFKLGRRHEVYLRQMARLMDGLGGRGLEVDYDQLCLHPTTWLGRIGSFLALDYTDVARRMAAGEALPRVPHLMRGNGRLRTAEAIVVRRDAAFETELSVLDQWLYQAGAGVVRLGVDR